MSIKSKYDSVNTALGIGEKKTVKRSKENLAFSKAATMGIGPVTETKVDKALRTTREALDKAEEALHDANAKSLNAAKRAMDVAQTAYSKAYKAHEKAGR